MNKYKFIYLIWLLPAYFLFQAGYQTLVYNGLNTTYTEGESYVAEVKEFEVKQIAAQTNGYVIITFTTSDGEQIEEKLSLPVQMAQIIMESEMIPVRYSKQSFRPIVMIPVFDLQKNVISVNLAVTTFGLIVTFIVAVWASKYASKRIRSGGEKLEIERIDSIESE